MNSVVGSFILSVTMSNLNDAAIVYFHTRSRTHTPSPRGEFHTAICSAPVERLLVSVVYPESSTHLDSPM
ncbi:hypothetical protein HGRIS_001583 [Hohenbuehelia grisea]|uniref:Secreted protein n=1 Tax=Hohenbuehelia grisea TaxID=104357 RepID=A0ABR3JRW1_9AGAR